MKVRIIDVNVVDEKVKVEIEVKEGVKRMKVVDLSGCWRCEESGCLGDKGDEVDLVVSFGVKYGEWFDVEKLCVLLR